MSELLVKPLSSLKFNFTKHSNHLIQTLLVSLNDLVKLLPLTLFGILSKLQLLSIPLLSFQTFFLSLGLPLQGMLIPLSSVSISMHSISRTVNCAPEIPSSHTGNKTFPKISHVDDIVGRVLSELRTQGSLLEDFPITCVEYTIQHLLLPGIRVSHHYVGLRTGRPHFGMIGNSQHIYHQV